MDLSIKQLGGEERRIIKIYVHMKVSKGNKDIV